jgi:beta-lactamase class D
MPTSTIFKSNPDFQAAFDRRGENGICLVEEAGKEEVLGCGLDRLNTRRRPMSTFKIINTLIALDSGVTGLSEEIEWDGGPAWSENLKTKLNLATALAGSALWYFQILARRIGIDRYKRYLTQSSYGNARCDSAIDQFWLDGSLLVSPAEQLEFLRRFSDEQLPFSREFMSAVREMLVLDRGSTGVLRGKTGYADSLGEHFGWFVGYLDTPARQFRVVTLLEMSNVSQLSDRRAIAEECLEVAKLNL